MLTLSLSHYSNSSSSSSSSSWQHSSWSFSSSSCKCSNCSNSSTCSTCRGRAPLSAPPGPGQPTHPGQTMPPGNILTWSSESVRACLCLRPLLNSPFLFLAAFSLPFQFFSLVLFRSCLCLCACCFLSPPLSLSHTLSLSLPPLLACCCCLRTRSASSDALRKTSCCHLLFSWNKHLVLLCLSKWRWMTIVWKWLLIGV